MPVSRFGLFGFLAGLVLSLSCGTVAPPKTCTPGECDGCCTEAGDCLAGTSVFECGAGGAACVACEANELCNAGSCGRFDGGDYDASFPERRDGSVNYDAGVYHESDGGSGSDGGSHDAGPADISWSTTIQPLLANKCKACHGFADNRAQLVNVNNRIVPNSPTSSTYYTRTLAGEMPQGGIPLTSTQQSQLRDWILNGAPNN